MGAIPLAIQRVSARQFFKGLGGLDGVGQRSMATHTVATRLCHR